MHEMRTFFAIAALAGMATTGFAQTPDRLDTSAGSVSVDVFAEGFVHPWAAEFLPDGRLLVTERPGRLRVVAEVGSVSAPLDGVPEVFARSQGGLLDLVLDPDFASNRLVYLSYAEERGPNSAATSVGRGRLNEEATALQDFEVIFRQEPAVPGGNHFGSRLAFSPDGTLFVTMGERFNYMEEAQNPANHLGTVARINPDGSVPRDNPFVGGDGADEIWSYGHRNVEGAAINPATGELWVVEMGPRGGDELNVPKAGANHGWPLVSWGRHYSGQPIPDPPRRPEFADAIRHWTPVISPSGIDFYTGDAFSEWRGDLLIGGLTARGIVRVDVEDGRAVGDERIDLGVRIRDVLEAPDGTVLALTDEDEGRILRLSPDK